MSLKRLSIKQALESPRQPLSEAQRQCGVASACISFSDTRPKPLPRSSADKVCESYWDNAAQLHHCLKDLSCNFYSLRGFQFSSLARAGYIHKCCIGCCEREDRQKEKKKNPSKPQGWTVGVRLPDWSLEFCRPLHCYITLYSGGVVTPWELAKERGKHFSLNPAINSLSPPHARVACVTLMLKEQATLNSPN